MTVRISMLCLALSALLSCPLLPSCFMMHSNRRLFLFSEQLRDGSSRQPGTRHGPQQGWPTAFLFSSSSGEIAAGPSLSSSPSMTTRRMGELTGPEERVYNIMKEIHASPYRWRVVVIGKGAILEATVAPLELEVRITQQPSTGANLLTMASADRAFEFHLSLALVSRLVWAVKETPKKTIRLLRMMNSNEEPMCSILLADESESAQQWFREKVDQYGCEIQL